MSPSGSQDLKDATPRILYKNIQTTRQKVMWREIDRPASEALVPNASGPVLGRWVQGERSIALTINASGQNQCAQYDVDTGTMTQLTFDASQKSDIYMWRAPEFNNELVFFCLSDRKSLPIYRKIHGKWTKINTIQSPYSTRPYLSSPEPFVYRGKSYISLMTKDSLNRSGGTSDIWVVGINPTVPFYRQASAPTPMNRRDPESFITAKGAFIYYTEVTSSNRMIIHRCATGLSPWQ
jgi:hypothetical protein